MLQWRGGERLGEREWKSELNVQWVLSGPGQSYYIDGYEFLGRFVLLVQYPESCTLYLSYTLTTP